MMLSRWPCHHLRIPLMVWFHKIFRLIFRRESFSYPKKYAEHWRTLTWNFHILLEQQFCRKLVNICVIEFAIYLFPRKHEVFIQHLVILVVFDFLFWFSSTIILSKIKSLFHNFCTSPYVTDLSIDYSGRYVLVYSFKFFRQ